MPELPEVETVVRDLRPLLVRRGIKSVWSGEKKLRTPWNIEWNELLLGMRITSIRRRGKWIILELQSLASDNAGFLTVHLGMTGQFTVVKQGLPQLDHLHIAFALDDGNELRFRDIRRFGCVTFHRNQSELENFFQAQKLGPEPFNVDGDYFRQVLQKSSRTLKAILLDQSVVAGVGNIYADEACFRARLHPERRGQSLTQREVDRLRLAIEEVLIRAIEQRGSTIRNYIGGSGLSGGFQDEFNAYGRTGLPCSTCQTAIKCVRLSGRASHFCPKCQKKSARKDR